MVKAVVHNAWRQLVTIMKKQLHLPCTLLVSIFLVSTQSRYSSKRPEHDFKSLPRRRGHRNVASVLGLLMSALRYNIIVILTPTIADTAFVALLYFSTPWLFLRTKGNLRILESNASGQYPVFPNYMTDLARVVHKAYKAMACNTINLFGNAKGDSKIFLDPLMSAVLDSCRGVSRIYTGW